VDLFLQIDEHPVESRLFSFAKSPYIIQQFSGCARSFFTVNRQRRHPVYLSSKHVTARSDDVMCDGDGGCVYSFSRCRATLLNRLDILVIV